MVTCYGVSEIFGTTLEVSDRRDMEVLPGSFHGPSAAASGPDLDQAPGLGPSPLLEAPLLDCPDAESQSQSSLSRFEMPGPHPLSSASSLALQSQIPGLEPTQCHADTTRLL